MLCQLGDMHMKRRHCSGGMEERARKSAIQKRNKNEIVEAECDIKIN